MDNMIQMIEAVIRSLNTVDVHGKQNYLTMAGSIDVLEQVQQKLISMMQNSDVEVQA